MSSHLTELPYYEVGKLNLFQLKRLWHTTLTNNRELAYQESHINRLLLNALGIGLQQGLIYLYSTRPSFAEFELWISDNAPLLCNEVVARFNSAIDKKPLPQQTYDKLQLINDYPDVLDAIDLEHWRKWGYVIVKNAVDPVSCEHARNAIWQYISASPDDPESWYGKNEQQIMLRLIQHSAFEKNRQSIKIHKAFSQIWGTNDLWCSADTCSINPPETEEHRFLGPDLHWDMDFNYPDTFRTQGILYLTDTSEQQGALTLVPGFHHKLKAWLQKLPPGVDPQQQNLKALNPISIAANAGDMIIWHHRLPHGSSPNNANFPRLAQYINYLPFHFEQWNKIP